MIIAVDLGTTHVKAAAFDATGTVITSAERRTTTVHTQPGWSEQDPDALFLLVLSVLQDVLQQPLVGHKKSAIQGIVFSSAMHGLVLVDAAGEALTPILLWSDLRAADAAQAWRCRADGGMDLYRRTGVPIHPMSPWCKLLWLRENQPGMVEKSNKILGIKEFIWYRLTGEYHSDISCASATGLMNVWTNEWDELALHTAGISEIQLPRLVLPGYKARSNGRYLPKNLLLIIGASDGALASLGSNAVESGHLAVTIGTSAAIRCVTEQPVIDDQMRSFCYRLDAQRCIAGGASNNGGNVLEWLQAGLFGDAGPVDDFLGQAASAPTGAAGVIFLPYLNGERAPNWDARARGAFQGISAVHGRAHFIRAVMEGILYNLKLIAGCLPLPNGIQAIHASGGFTQNPFWVQMLADIFQSPVMLGEATVDAAVLGAVQTGRMALGLDFVSLERYQRTIYPQPQTDAAYRRGFELFQQYQAIKFS